MLRAAARWTFFWSGFTRVDKQTLIITNSRDLTVDRLIHRIGPNRIFRFNLDIWEEYRIWIRAADFEIANPVGRVIRRGQVAKCLWRKPMIKSQLYWKPGIPQETIYVELEVDKAIREIRNVLRRDNKLVLIEPASGEWLGKLVQMELACKYFSVPRYEFAYPPQAGELDSGPIVVKSLSEERVKPGHHFWTSPVDAAKLNRTLPWLKQARVDATHDVTVVFIRGKSFGFALDRSILGGKTVDWRQVGTATIPNWKPHRLPEATEEAIFQYMEELRLHYGRLDFLYDGKTYYYLEVNTNGEWDWLDPDKGLGVMDRIIAEIHPDMPIHPLPVRY